MDSQLIDQIYEAAVFPEFWPRVLDAIARRVASEGAILFTLSSGDVSRWTCSEGVGALMEAWVEGGWQTRTRRAPRMMARKHAGFVGDLDLFTHEELASEPDQVEFLRPRGFGWGAGTFIPMPSGDVAVFDIERRFDVGPFARESIETLDAFRQHLARSALLSIRLGLERARAAVAALEAVDLPAAVLTWRGRVVATNPLLGRMTGQIAVGAFDRLAVSRPAAHDLALAALKRMLTDPDCSGSSIALPATDELPAAVAHLLPIRRAMRDIFLQGHALLVVTPLTRSNAPHADLLSGLFDLTPAEARVARGLTEGQTLDALASITGVSRETVRNQLKAVLCKTGTHRQAELVSLLGGLALSR